MATETMAPVASGKPRSVQPPSFKRARRLVQRNMLVYKHTWMVIFSGFFEPIFYLFGIGLGIGRIVGKVDFGGLNIAYAAFIAPGMLASSCLNGAITDGFFNPFFKLHYQKTYEGILATPMNVSDVAVGEMMWALIRGSIYAAVFLLVMLAMGLVLSPLAVLALPAAILTAAAFSSAGIMLMTIVKRIEDFDKVMNLIVLPMFLFSGTFFPLSVYPPPLRIVVMLTPLYNAAHLLRSLTTGIAGWGTLVNVFYLAAMLAITITIAMKRMQRILIQ
ncbi:MAG: ABC transporter permease [Actinomycetota bacterium]|nr:ABC transporter permease [Actinomycetota bacterium]